MNAQSMNNPRGGERAKSLKTRPGISIPLSNEIAAVFIGEGLTHPDTEPEARAEAEEKLAQFENFKVVYAQNTADEMNVVVPYFPELECEMEKITEEQLEEVAGGEIVLFVGPVGIFFAKIGVMVGVGSLSVGVCAAATTGLTTVSTVVAGVAAFSAVVGAAAGVIGGAIAGVGVGIAAAVGAFDGGGSVSVGHAS